MAFQVAASFLSVRIVLEGWPFGPRLFRSFLSKERIMAQKYFREMGNFGQHVPRHQSKMISRYRDLGILFCSWKRFGRFETVSKSWCVPNYQMSVFFKNSSFFVAWFPKNSRRFANQESYGQLPEKAWSKGFIRFFKIVPLEVPKFSTDSQSERKYLSRWVYYQQ